MVNKQEPLFPAWSVAVMVTVWIPLSSDDPLSTGEEVKVKP